MNLAPRCLLYSQDEELRRRVSAFLAPLADVRSVERPARLEVAAEQAGPTVLLVDMLAQESRVLLSRVIQNMPRALVVVLGAADSEPVRDAEAQGVYAVLGREEGRRRVQEVYSRALGHLRLLEENRLLREQNDRAVPPPAAACEPRPARALLPSHLRDFSRAYRHVGNVDSMLEHIIEGVAGCAQVARAGIFCQDRAGRTFRLRAGVKCLEDTGALEFDESDAFVRWLEIHAHLVARATLEHVVDPAERLLLSQMLDRFGAEIILPLHGRDRLMGWLFAGRRVTGIPFSAEDMESLVALADHASNALENALLYEEVTLQKSLAETLLQSIPVGIVALGADRNVRWFSRNAEALLDLSAEDVCGQPASKLGGRLGGLLSKCVEGEATKEPVTWDDPLSGHSLSVLTRQLKDGSRVLGAVAVVEDLTQLRALQEKQQRLERAAFWQDLAAAIAHEVRGPLVAINTYFQLLPERHDDPDFRQQFGELVPREISRLNKMVEQINDFANPPDLNFETLPVDAVLKQAVTEAKERTTVNGVSIELAVDPGVPRVRGDRAALVDSLAHLVVNAVEGVQGRQRPAVRVRALGNGARNGDQQVRIDVEDNGGGIPLDISEKLFSPFSTKKARGIGLGLPIVKRTVTDHDGQVNIETGDKGTVVSVSLPAAPSERNPDS